MIHLAQLPTSQGDQTMSDTVPGEKPVNDGGGNAPQPEPEPEEEEVTAEKPANQGGGSD